MTTNCVLGTFFAEIVIAKIISEAKLIFLAEAEKSLFFKNI